MFIGEIFKRFGIVVAENYFRTFIYYDLFIRTLTNILFKFV